MTASIVVAVISALVALFSALWSARTTLRVEREKRDLDEANRRVRVVERYREPLVRSAQDLQSRLYNILEQLFIETFHAVDRRHREYVEYSTAYVVAEYLAWAELLRRDVEFLDLGDDDRSRRLAGLMSEVRKAMATDSLPMDMFRLYAAEQRAVGEIMLVPTKVGDTEQVRPMGYAEFVTRMGDDAFARWSEPLRTGVGRPFERARAVRIQHLLVDVVEFLDDPPRRIDRAHLAKVRG